MEVWLNYNESKLDHKRFQYIVIFDYQWFSPPMLNDVANSHDFAYQAPPLFLCKVISSIELELELDSAE